MQLLRWNNAKPIQGHDTRQASSTTEKAGCRGNLPAFRSREKYFLDIPFYRPAITRFDRWSIHPNGDYIRAVWTTDHRVPAEAGASSAGCLFWPVKRVWLMGKLRADIVPFLVSSLPHTSSMA